MFDKLEDLLIRFEEMCIRDSCSEDEVSKENGLPEETNLAGYVSIIREVAEFYGLPVLDLFFTSGLQPKVDIIKDCLLYTSGRRCVRSVSQSGGS